MYRVHYKFTGKERDAETGLDDLGARYLSGAFGRLMSADSPLTDQNAGSPDSWNLYSYVRNNPLKYTDPTGEDCVYVYTYTDEKVTGAVETGKCTRDGGTFVDGKVDLNSFKRDGQGDLEFGYTTANGGGVVSYTPSDSARFIGEMSARADASKQMIGAFAAADAVFAASYTAIAYAPSAIAAIRAAQAARTVAQAAVALKAAIAALKSLPPDQYRLLQQWLGPIKACSPLTPPPPGLTIDAMQRYLPVAQAYVNAGGSGREIQLTRIQAIQSALGHP